MDKQGMDPQAIPSLTRIGGLARRKQGIEEQLDVEVAYARAMGASWRLIGTALGTSTQAAWEKYRPQQQQKPLPGQEPLWTSPEND